MELRLHRDVRDQDGNKLGELRHVVLDPSASQVVSLVVQRSRFDTGAVIVPADIVAGGDGDAVYLQPTTDQLDHLQAYAYGVNLAPPPADIDPETESTDLPQEPIDVPDVPPVGAAQGITTTAFTPILEVVRNLPDDSIVIDDGTLVSAADGNLGHVRSVLLDDGTRAVIGLLVRTGRVFTRDVEVPLAWVASVGSERVTLSMDRAAVFAADEERPST